MIIKLGLSVAICEEWTCNVHEECFVGAADWVANVSGAFQHSLGEIFHHQLLEYVQRKERTRHEVRLRRPHTAQPLLPLYQSRHSLLYLGTKQSIINQSINQSINHNGGGGTFWKVVWLKCFPLILVPICVLPFVQWAVAASSQNGDGTRSTCMRYIIFIFNATAS